MSELKDAFTAGSGESVWSADDRDSVIFCGTFARSLPSTWQIASLEEVSYKITDGTHEPVVTVGYESDTVPFLYVSCIGDNRIKWDEAACIPISRYKLIGQGRIPVAGMVLYTAVGSYGKAALVQDARPFAFQRHIACIYPNISLVDPAFVAAWLNGSFARRYADIVAIGNAQKTVTLGALARFPIPVPAKGEQRSIAQILDAADEAIRSTERLIAKLERTNQGLIHGILARGANEWPYSSVDSEFDIKTGITLGPHRATRNHPKAYLRVANVQRNWIDARDIAYLEASSSESVDYALAVNDLLVVEGHANPWEIGRCAIVEQAQSGLLYQNHLFRLRARRVLPRFALLWLNSASVQSYWWRRCATSSGLNTINSRQLKALPFPVPHPEEQERVMEAATSSSSRLSAERVKLHKLRMLKQGLMDDLLAGRVRVGASA